MFFWSTPKTPLITPLSNTQNIQNETKVANRCGAWNCLNATNLPPSQRNAAVGADCVGAGAPTPANACAGVTHWDPSAPKRCTTYEYSAKGAAGYCGTDGLCWYTNVDFTTVLAETNSMLDTFMKNSCVNNMQVKTGWSFFSVPSPFPFPPSPPHRRPHFT